MKSIAKFLMKKTIILIKIQAVLYRFMHFIKSIPQHKIKNPKTVPNVKFIKSNNSKINTLGMIINLKVKMK